MIKSIHFENFFSFSNQTIELSQLNALIGINGSGKTNFIKAIQLLKSILSEDELPDLIINRWGGFDSMCFIGNEEKPHTKLSVEFIFEPETLSKYGCKFMEDIHYKISFFRVGSGVNYSVTEQFQTKSGYQYLYCRNGKANAKEGIEQKSIQYEFDNTISAISQLVDKDRYFHIYTLREAIKDIAVYKYFNTTETSPIRKPVPPTSSNRLAFDGANLPQVLNSIKINNRNDFCRITEAMKVVNPNFVGIDYNIFGGNIELLLEEDKLRKPIHISHVSDGTLRYLCLLSIILNPRKGRLVCIDEPEVGLHPDMINEIVEVIANNSDDTQFIISTHSEHVLNQLAISNVLVFEKDENNCTVVKDFKKDAKFSEWAADYSLGKLWRNGDLGGNRY